MGSSNHDSSATDSDVSSTKPDPDSEMDIDEDSPCIYQVGEKVLALHCQYYYEAKVINVKYQLKRWMHYVHYAGWKKSWDEWVGKDRLLKYTDENVQKFLKKDLEKTSKAVRQSQNKPKSYGVARGRKRKNDPLNKEEDLVSVEKFANLQIPPIIKKQLVDDCELITHLGKLVKLPRTPNVEEIMKKYLDYRLKIDGSTSEAVREITKGLSCYFNKALPVMLLYKSERQQYTDAIKDDVSPSAIYGAEHLLRLFVKLPELLAYANIDKDTLMELQHRLVDFLKFLQKNRSTFFLSTYHVPEDTKTGTDGQNG